MKNQTEELCLLAIRKDHDSYKYVRQFTPDLMSYLIENKIIRKKKKFDGQLAIMYVFLYSIARITAEFFRQPDIQLGFLLGTSWLTMGMIISFVFALLSSLVYIKIKK